MPLPLIRPLPAALIALITLHGVALPAAAQPVQLDVDSVTLPEVREHVEAITAEPGPATDAPATTPARTVFMPIRYANAGELASLLDDARVSVDGRTNTLIIRGSDRAIQQARTLVERLDVPVRQVLIEARIVIASDDFSNEIGVRFNAARRNQTGDTRITSGGTLDADGLMVDLPASNAAGGAGVAIGKIGSYLLELELSAMESENKGEIISSPRVVTASNQQAEIKQGVQIPFEQATSSGATSIAFREAVLGLVATPQITPDDQVQLTLAINQDSRGEETPEGPAINTQAVRTHVLVADGETVVLGGVFEQTRRDGVRRVPGLSDLPLVGQLFQRRTAVNDRSELLIFVTPRILEAPGTPTNAIESEP
jgi:type IV pilus assembly protein PilQ